MPAPTDQTVNDDDDRDRRLLREAHQIGDTDIWPFFDDDEYTIKIATVNQRGRFDVTGWLDLRIARIRR